MGGQWVILVRMHPSATELQKIFVYTNKILNASVYPEINELIVACDYLITDYSSCMFDAMLTKTRIVRYASDIANYEEERGSNFDYVKLPLPLATNNEEMSKIINEYKTDKELERRDKFLREWGIVENGTAAHAVVDRIIQVLKRAKEI